ERRRLARDLERSGVTDDGAGWVARAEREAMAALEELGPSLGRELSRAVPMLRTKITGGSLANPQQIGVVTRVCTILSASGQATRGTAGGAWYDRLPRWVRMQDWVPEVTEQPPPTPAAARGELARRWLAAFGPASFDDLTWWTGWTVRHTRAALADAGAVEVDLDGTRAGIALADDLEPTPAPSPWVTLLPSLDPTTMGWKDRDWYLGTHRSRLFDSNGNAGPTIWSEGRVVGGWAQRPAGQVVLEFLEDVGAEAVALGEAEADRLTTWLGGTVVRPSFPTPLQRELST
ncbi:MAG: crosslink repair DNA glycosylase YcaQ family protein, partial [Nocardioidaceae bacterium]